MSVNFYNFNLLWVSSASSLICFTSFSLILWLQVQIFKLILFSLLYNFSRLYFPLFQGKDRKPSAAPSWPLFLLFRALLEGAYYTPWCYLCFLYWNLLCLRREKKHMPSNKQLNTTVFMEEYHVVKDVGHWEKMPSWRIYKEHQWDETSKNLLAHHSLP